MSYDRKDLKRKNEIYIWDSMIVLVLKGGIYPLLKFSDGRIQRTELSPSQFRCFYTLVGTL